PPMPPAQFGRYRFEQIRHGGRGMSRTQLWSTLIAAGLCNTLSAQEIERLPPVQTPTVEVEYGPQRPIIDGVGWVVGIPRKVLLWDRRADNHAVSDETVGEVSSYLHERGVEDVKVRVNQYAPWEEWKRLTTNKNVGAGWRYTVGTLKCLEYTIIPGRLFG